MSTRFGVIRALVVASVVVAATASAADDKSSPVPPTDRTIAAADEAKKAVEQREAQIVKLLSEITEHVDQLQPGQFEREKVAWDKFKVLIPALRDQATWLLGKEGEFTKQFTLLKCALEKAPKAEEGDPLGGVVVDDLVGGLDKFRVVVYIDRALVILGANRIKVAEIADHTDHLDIGRVSVSAVGEGLLGHNPNSGE